MSRAFVVLGLLGFSVAVGCAATPTDRADFDETPASPDAGSTAASPAPPQEEGPSIAAPTPTAPPENPPVQACAGESVAAVLEPLPADIVWVIDNSSSMSDEIAAVRGGINAFATQLATSGIDYHLVMLSKRGTAQAGSLWPVCVPEPLAGPNCGNTDRFLHADFPQEGIKSVQPLEQLLGSLGQTQGYKVGDSGGRGGEPWRAHLRAEASKAIVVVSDDNSRLSSNAFLHTPGGLVSTVSGGSPSCTVPPGLEDDAWNGLFDHLVVHAMVGPTGSVYRELAEATGGVTADLGEAGGADSTAWSTFFTTVATQVVTAAHVSCTMPIPAPPTGQTLDPDRVNVQIATNTGKVTVPRVLDASGCGTDDGWYYAGTDVALCPASCETMNAVTDQSARGADVVFGCTTVTHVN